MGIFNVQSLFAVDVVFRYDDYCLEKNSIQEQILQTFDKHHIPLTIAIIPFDKNETLLCDSNEVSRLKKYIDCGKVEVAIHGNSHKQRAENGEFGGLDYNQQAFLLSQSKKAIDSLFSISCKTFIPPWNDYDNNTLTILDSLGIKIISSCLTVGQSFDNPNINYYPATVGSYEAFISFQKALRHNKHRDGIIVFMFHEYDFEDFTFENLDKLLDDIEKSANIHCMRFCDLNQKSDKGRMEANIEVNLLSKFLGVCSMNMTSTHARLIRVINLLLYLFLLFVFSIICSSCTKKKKSNYYWIVTTILFSIVIYFCVWLHFWTPLKSLLLCFLLPICALIIFNLFQTIKKHFYK